MADPTSFLVTNSCDHWCHAFGDWLIVDAFSLVLLPLIAFLQRLLAPVENTTSVSDRDYLLGTVTLAVSDGHTGEVMVTGGGLARQTYPAKLWSGTHQTLAQGTKVVIIELKQGIAYVDAFRRA